MHKDIGKRVKWMWEGGTGYGKLMAIGCGPSHGQHLVQCDDFGWTLEKENKSPYYNKAREQGVKDGTTNLFWVENYELMSNLNGLKAGTILKIDGYFYRVIVNLGGEGELETYGLSIGAHNPESEHLKCASTLETVYELEKRGYEVYEEKETIEIDGKKWNISTIKEALKKAED